MNTLRTRIELTVNTLMIVIITTVIVYQGVRFDRMSRGVRGIARDIAVMGRRDEMLAEIMRKLDVPESRIAELRRGATFPRPQP